MPAQAHLLNMTRVSVALAPQAPGTLEVEIDLGQSLLSAQDYLDLARAPLAQRSALLAPVLARLETGLILTVDGAPLERRFESAEFVAESLAAIRNPLSPQMATLRWTLPSAAAGAVEIRLAEDLEVPWPCLVRLDSAQRELPVSRLLTADRRASDPLAIAGDAAPGAGTDAPLTILGVYGYLGVQHIVPLGLDHVLFVLGLFLVGGRFRELLLLVSCFTVAHTLTLGAAALGIVSLPSRPVEALIALSIVYVGAEALFGRRPSRWRYLVVFAFGLLHGLGFAGVLREIGLPESNFLLALLAFNVGVELGQLLVIGAAFALVGAFRARSWYGPCIVQPSATVVSGFGVYWLLQRLLN